MTWQLLDYITEKVLSSHPDENGAKLSALFHVKNGEKIYWKDSKVSLQIASCYGEVDSSRRFKVRVYE